MIIQQTDCTYHNNLKQQLFLLQEQAMQENTKMHIFWDVTPRRASTEIPNGRCAFDTSGNTRPTHCRISGPASSAAQLKFKFCTNALK